MKKSKTNKKLEGVLGGIGEYYNIDPTLLRLGYLLLGLFEPTLAIVLYIGACIIMD